MILPFGSSQPRIATTVYIAPGAVVVGDVEIADQASLWFNVVVRGDVHFIRIGPRTNIQDGTVVHVTHDTHPTVIGADVTVGHNASIHGCTIEDGCLIGIGAMILDGVRIGAGSLVAAGTLVAPETAIPPGSLVMGSPGRVKRSLSDAERDGLLQNARNYVDYRQAYLDAVQG